MFTHTHTHPNTTHTHHTTHAVNCDTVLLGNYPTSQVTQYKGYGQNDRTIKIFWVVCHALPKDAKKRLLGKFHITFKTL